jgi:hypothetical protein
VHNFGAVSAGFLLKAFDGWSTGLFVLGGIVMCVSTFAFFVRFSEADDREASLESEAAVAGGNLAVET